MESRAAAAPREEQTKRGRHLPWQRAAAGTARLQFEGTAEAGAGPGLPTPSPRPAGTCPSGQRGGGPGRAARAKSCVERQGKVSSLTAEQAPAEPSDIETICEGFGRRERAGQAGLGTGGLLFGELGGRWAPPEPPSARGTGDGGSWRGQRGSGGRRGWPGSDPCTDTSGPSPECRIEKLPGWFGLRSRPPPTRSLRTRGMRGHVGHFGGGGVSAPQKPPDTVKLPEGLRWGPCHAAATCPFPVHVREVEGPPASEGTPLQTGETPLQTGETPL